MILTGCCDLTDVGSGTGSDDRHPAPVPHSERRAKAERRRRSPNLPRPPSPPLARPAFTGVGTCPPPPPRPSASEPTGATADERPPIKWRFGSAKSERPPIKWRFAAATSRAGAPRTSSGSTSSPRAGAGISSRPPPPPAPAFSESSSAALTPREGKRARLRATGSEPWFREGQPHEVLGLSTAPTRVEVEARFRDVTRMLHSARAAEYRMLHRALVRVRKAYEALR